MIRKKSQTLSDRISNLLDTAPKLIDPEDDVYDNTAAKVISNEDDLTSDLDESIQNRSEIRGKNLLLLENVDERYAGKRSSRKDLTDSDDFTESLSDNTNANSFVNSDDENVNSVSDNDDNAISESENYEKELSQNNNEQESSNFKHLTNNIQSQIQKGTCVRNQLNLWENLLETRIKMQKCLLTANKFPQNETFCKIKNQRNADFESVALKTTNGIKNVLDNLLFLQETLLKSYPETKKLSENNIEEKINDTDDEEIPSDTENESEDSDDERKIIEPPKKRNKNFIEYENIISTRHQNYKNYRNNTIRKWYEKTRLAVAKNLGNSNSVINQIEFILKDREKCVKRTQLKRSNYKIVGYRLKDNTDVVDTSKEKLQGNKRSHDEYNQEIFDDDDFYHQMLRELIEFKSADITDPIKLSQQWTQLQNMRSKMKRNIDTRATKGRKIRYVVHSKLVNFMAPIANEQWTDLATNELFNSLFGGKIIKK